MSVIFLKYVFVVLHVLTAAGWFGLALRVSSQARLVLNLDRAAAGELAEQTGKTVRMMGIFLILTFVFSLAAFFLGGGFETYGPVYHTSLLLIVLLLADHYLLIGRPWRKLERGVNVADPVAAGDLAGARKRMAAGVGIGHLLWVTLLVLMFWSSLAAGV